MFRLVIILLRPDCGEMRESDGERFSVLHVEDNAIDALATQQRLKQVFPDAEVHQAETVAAAQSHMESRDFDLILLDLNVPDSQGLATIEAFAGVTEDTAVVVLTGNEIGRRVRLQIIEMGYQDFLVKSEVSADSFRTALGYAVKRKELEREARRLARIDPLTGVLNRRALISTLKRFLDGQKAPGRVGVLFFDVDSLKEINDKLGHSHGDEVLRHLTRLVASELPGEAVLGRLGGDEFAVLVPDSGPRQLLALARSLDGGVADPPPSAPSTTVRCSWGIAIQQPDSDAYSMLSEADSAMYEAKKDRSRSIVVFDELLRSQGADRDHDDRELRAANARGYDTFSIRLEAIVDLTSERVVGHEARLFWDHPREGLVPRAVFDESLQRLGHGAEVDLWLLRTAHELLSQEGDPWPETIHVSLSQASTRSLAPVLALLREFAEAGDWSPERLVLGINSGCTTFIPPEVQDQVREIRAMGIPLALIGFGSQPSTFLCFSLVQFSWVKLGEDLLAAGLEVVTVVHEALEKLRVGVIVTGVNDAGLAAELRAGGVRFVQGDWRPA